MNEEVDEAVTDDRVPIRQELVESRNNALVLVPAYETVPHLKCGFYNTTSRNVDVIWIQQDGSTQRYNTLMFRRFMVVNTYEGHRWKFCDSQDGEVLPSFPTGRLEVSASANTRYVAIRANTNNLSLRRSCVRTICAQRERRPEFLRCLRLPYTLELELAEYLIRCIEYQSKYSREIAEIRAEKVAWLSEYIEKKKTTDECIRSILHLDH